MSEQLPSAEALEKRGRELLSRLNTLQAAAISAAAEEKRALAEADRLHEESVGAVYRAQQAATLRLKQLEQHRQELLTRQADYEETLRSLSPIHFRKKQDLQDRLARLQVDLDRSDAETREAQLYFAQQMSRYTG